MVALSVLRFSPSSALSPPHCLSKHGFLRPLLPLCIPSALRPALPPGSLTRSSTTSLLLDSPQQAYKNHVLILFSLIFYAWGEPLYVFLMRDCVVLITSLASRYTAVPSRVSSSFSATTPCSARSNMPISSGTPSMLGASR